ncbi:DUF2807 domain-containing protein [uncultured Bacteroides sp.]|uniref:GIN domain-containing protein n=1 Tax=uncultured Bacteroides sp. TaxID=162156 RepID=UPI002636D60D|nr:DUF2807 domain-containing protein [uncultured Bacteroides sp.]
MKASFLSRLFAVSFFFYSAVSVSYAGHDNELNYVTKEVKVSKITSISTTRAVDVSYYQTAGKPRVEIYAPDYLLHSINVSDVNGDLQISMKSQDAGNSYFSFTKDCDFEVRVYAPDVFSFSSGLASSIKFPDGLSTKRNVFIEVKGGGVVQGGAIKCRVLQISAEQSGDIDLGNVTCDDADVKAKTKAKVKIGCLMSKLADIGSSSSSVCSVDALITEKEAKFCTITSGTINVSGMNCRGRIFVQSSTSGETILEGACEEGVLNAAEAGKISASSMTSKKMEVVSVTGGDVTCQTSGKLKVEIDKISSVKYTGNPKKISGDKKRAIRF